MDATFYTEQILENTLLPTIQMMYPEGHRFQQDNDPKHTSKKAKEFMAGNGINWWPTPPESPDLNPIENLWHELKHYLRKVHKPHSAEELRQGVETFWCGLTAERCQRYINHIHNVIPVVIEREGKASGY